MKWIILIVVLAVLAGVLYLRLVRSGGRVSDSRGPHRLDDSISMSDTSGARTEPQTNDPSANGSPGPGEAPTA